MKGEDSSSVPVNIPLELDPARLQALCGQVLGALRQFGTAAAGTSVPAAALWTGISAVATALAGLPPASPGTQPRVVRRRGSDGEFSIDLDEPRPAGGAPSGVTFAFGPGGELESAQLRDFAAAGLSIVVVTRRGSEWDVASSANEFKAIAVDASGRSQAGDSRSRAARAGLSASGYSQGLYHGLVLAPDPDRAVWEEGLRASLQAWKAADVEAAEHGRQVTQATQAVGSFLASVAAEAAEALRRSRERPAPKPPPSPEPDPKPSPEPSPVLWHYQHDGKAAGPVTETELRRMLREGTLSSATYVWNANLTGWVHAGETGLITAPKTAPPAKEPAAADHAAAVPKGASTIETIAVTPAADHAPRPLSTRHCHRCGARLKPETQFCGTCGGPTRPAMSTCPACGHALKPGGRFCGGCGRASDA